MSNYHMDLNQLSLDWYQETLRAKELMPGRRVLHDSLDERFAAIRGKGVETLGQLVEAMRTKPRLQNFALLTGLEEQYLVILKRDAMSYIPQPVALGRFPGVKSALVQGLAGLGIQHSKHLFERITNEADVKGLATEMGTDPAELRTLRGMADLARIYGVGPVFARIFHDAGVTSVAVLLGREPGEIFTWLKRRSQEAGDIVNYTEQDIEQCLEMAGLLPESGI
ncbi:MAG: DUF4332 domain-containing protein [Desulfovibrio sp.]|nr:MAG: DUF4332 domain-containing protein [Desulfovibrio sp.]